MSFSARNIANGLEDMMKEAVESYMDDFDFTEVFQNEMPDIGEKVEEAIDDADISQLVKDEVDNIDLDEKINEAIDNFDFDEIVGNKVSEYLNSEEFKDKLNQIQMDNLNKIISEKLWFPVTYTKKLWKNFCFDLYVLWIEIYNLCQKK